MEYKILKTEKGKDSILLNGYIFYKNGESSNTTTYWRCSNYYTTKCCARIIVDNKMILKQSSEHNHAANAAKVEANKKIENLRD